MRRKSTRVAYAATPVTMVRRMLFQLSKNTVFPPRVPSIRKKAVAAFSASRRVPGRSLGRLRGCEFL
jgi:hypothetical protein